MPTSRAGTSSRRGRRNTAGFTLLELTVTLVIISVVLAFTLPRLGNLSYDGDLKLSVRMLRSLLLAARSRAVSDRVPRRVVCDLATGEVRVEREVREAEEDGTSLVTYEPDTSVLLRPYHLPRGVRFLDVVTGAGEKITEGEASFPVSAGGMVAGRFLHLEKEDKRFTLRIDPLTGGVSLEEGYQEEYYATPSG